MNRLLFSIELDPTCLQFHQIPLYTRPLFVEQCRRLPENVLSRLLEEFGRLASALTRRG